MIVISLIVFLRQGVWFQILVLLRVGNIVNISSPPSVPGFPGVAWRFALPTTPPELIHRDFGESCARQAQRSQEWGLVPGGLFADCEAIKARRALIEECKNWRPPWVTWWEPYKHPPGWPELFIDRKPVPPQPADKAKPFHGGRVWVLIGCRISF